MLLSLTANFTNIGDMMKRYLLKVIPALLALSAVFILYPLTATEKREVENVFRPASFEAHVRFLSDDLLEGRGINTRGGKLAKLYIESVFRAAGLEPANKGSFIQSFDMNVFASDSDASFDISGEGVEIKLKYGDEYIGANLGLKGDTISAKPVFIGYGIHLPEKGWDYYKNFDAKGKLLIGFTNEPGRNNPKIFKGKDLTFYGRWTYKYEEAARQGAAGLILIHNDADAGYGWEVVRNSWSGNTFKLSDDPYILPLQFWVNEKIGEQIASLSGYTLNELRKMAERKDFQSVELNMDISLKSKLSVKPSRGANVIGIVEGTDPALKNKAVILTAHYDHLGIGRSIKGDNIYNGALDNGTALSVLLSMAQVYGEGQLKSPVTLLFAAVDAEEEGLLGSLHYARNPSIEREKILANINFEMSNAWGRTKDIMAIGAEKSDLLTLIKNVAEERGMSFTPDPVPAQGFFFRSDQFSFARVGIPSVWLDTGLEYIGKPGNWGVKMRSNYRTSDYHRPTDEVRSSWDYGGLVQLAEFTVELIDKIAKESKVDWAEGAEFSR